MSRHAFFVFFFAFSVAFVSACDDEDPVDDVLADEGVCNLGGNVSYQNTIADIAATRCGTCHSEEAAQPQEPFFVDQWRDANWALGTGEVSPEWFAAVIADGSMPIAQAEPLTDGEKDLVASWAGGHVGDLAAIIDLRVDFQTDLEDIYAMHCARCHADPAEPDGAPYYSMPGNPTLLDMNKWEAQFAEVAFHVENRSMPARLQLAEYEKQPFYDYASRQSDATWALLEPTINATCMQCHGTQAPVFGTTMVDRNLYDPRAGDAASAVWDGRMPKVPLDTEIDTVSAWAWAVGLSMSYELLYGSDLGDAAVTRVSAQDRSRVTRPVTIGYTATDHDTSDATVSLFWSTSNEEIDGGLIEECLPPSATVREHVWETAGGLVPDSPAAGYYVWACVHDDDNIVCDFSDDRVVITN